MAAMRNFEVDVALVPRNVMGGSEVFVVEKIRAKSVPIYVAV
jgi:hypothetical protein